MTVIDDIRAELPGYTRRREQLDAIKTERTRRLRASEGVNPYVRPERHVLQELLDAGEPLDQLDQQVAARLAAEQAAGAAHNALVQMQELLQTEVRALENDARAVLPLLGQRLADIVAEIKTLEPLAEILTAEDVLASRRLDDGERLASLLQQVSALRAEQSRIYQANDDPWGKLAVLRVIRNPQDLFDDWAVWVAPGYRVHATRRGETRQVDVPWPMPLQRAVTASDFTLWCLRSGAELWIPSPDEYDAAVRDLRAKANRPRTDTGEGEWRDPGPGQHTTARPLTNRRGRGTAHVIQ